MQKKININPKSLKLDWFNYEEGIKYSILPGIVDEKTFFIVNEKNLIDALNYYSKLEQEFDILITDEASYNRLLSQILEIKTQKDLENKDIEYDEEVSLEDFVKNSLDILNSENAAPIIKFVNSMFYQALKKKASDIHIETHENYGLLRFRMDGILISQAQIEKKVIGLIINRIKVISNLDISEKRMPQDGRTQIKIDNKQVDIRVSIIPTYFGEKVVMRILMESGDIPTLRKLGFNEEIGNGFKSLLERSYGMILVTGPTGSGKSTTLHSFLQTIASSEKNIITVEDPVEYKADNINQIQVNQKVGLNFATALKTILRQDPDMIMVGEVRDKETAQIAIQAALTGHLMLSTLHTNNAVATIVRLIDMGIEPFLISSSLIGILSQRLVRRLCPNCKKQDNKFKNDLKENFSLECDLYEPVGCVDCNFTGYKGRKSIGELVIINDDVKLLIANGSNEVELKKYMKESNIKTLQDNILELLCQGEISYEEAIRIGLKDI